jgi:hypothetical protein
MTLWLPEQAINAFDESGRMTTWVADTQLLKTLRTLKVWGSMIVTLPLARLLTTRLVPSGEMRATPGASPVPMAAISRRAARSITETLFESEFGT